MTLRALVQVQRRSCLAIGLKMQYPRLHDEAVNLPSDGVVPPVVRRSEIRNFLMWLEQRRLPDRR